MKPSTAGDPERNGMTRETMVQLLGVVVFAATVLVTVLAVAHLL